MSAAGPLPSHATNGHPSGYPPSRSDTPNSAGDRKFAHIQDLKNEALTDFSPAQSIGSLFERANSALLAAKRNIDFRRPDLAFVEYLRAYEIAVEVIPKHRDYILFAHDQHGGQKLQLLQQKINSMNEQFDGIKGIIVNNNKRFGVLPKSQQYQQSQNVGGHARGDSAGAIATNGKVKPSPSPKPEKLHARAVSHANVGTNGTSSSPGDPLADRFAKLRLGQGETSTRPSSRGSSTSVSSGPLAMPYAGDYRGSLDASSRSSFTAARPQGPRGMPESSMGPPPLPSKLIIGTEIAAAMPKAPSPTYSPARNMQTTGNIAPPRYSARSLVTSSSRMSSLIPSSSASATAPNGSGDYFGQPTSDGVATPGAVLRRKSVHMPKETRLSAERLYDYIERYSVLLIDFRNREEFDQGHIFTRNIICVEPMITHQGMSASELADKLVLSPDDEQDMFHHRDQYDLVVYYDNQTQSESYLTRPTTDSEARLRWLHEALYDFNQDRPLQRPPILLIGGISAWIDLIGHQALMSTNTQRARQGRPIQRRAPPPSGQPRIPKRRLREYNPFDAEEERKWRERANSESVPETTAFVPGSEDEALDGIDEEQALPGFPTIESFNARFPDAGSLGQQRFGAPASRPPPERPAKVPQYPAAPAPSVYPPVPARPAPAAPRMSYTGVSDRAVSQNQPAPRTSSQLTPYIPPKYMSNNIRLPRTGLINFGSTCYLNATLQALSATTPLSILFLDDQYRNLVQKDNWKGSRGLLPDIYSNTIRSLWKGDVNCIKPSTLFNFVGRLNSIFKDPGQQQDAQEFFSMIVDVLHEDFNSMWARTPLRALTEQEEAKRERMPKTVVAKTEWGRYTHRENSFLTSLFYGQQSSRLQCPKCGMTSTQYDAWALLQVEIPDCKEARLQDCLRQHFGDELLDEENQWTCPNCKAPRRARKKLTMTRAPPFLVIGLKRFKTNPRTGDQRKIHTAVRFPLVGLDIEELVLPQPSPKEVQDIAASYGPDMLKADSSQSPPYIYDAYAVVRHMGESTRSGHYTTAVKDQQRGCWRYFNDTQVTDFQPESESRSKALDNDQAYLVFYKRRQVHEVNKI
ncbi:cysteine ase [Lecanosticta acicola]|uniref:Cysteine ase n=1 Tax=Lecanosticta acicola TaxID=111012 RepID=A0AAI8Z2G4_9PEZI|nr:cysteine ase [Lecanosticta acicola]